MGLKEVTCVMWPQGGTCHGALEMSLYHGASESSWSWGLRNELISSRCHINLLSEYKQPK